MDNQDIGGKQDSWEGTVVRGERPVGNVHGHGEKTKTKTKGRGKNAGM